MPPSASPICSFIQNAIRNRSTAGPQPSAAPVAPAIDTLETANANAPSTQPSASITEPTRKHAHSVHIVLTHANRIKMVKWMIEHVTNNGEIGLSSVVISKFPENFRGTPAAKYMRAKRLWDHRHNIMQSVPSPGSCFDPTISSVSSITRAGATRVMKKASAGRGRKRAMWTIALQDDLGQEFSRLRKLGVKFRGPTVQALAKSMIQGSAKDEYHAEMTVESKRKVGAQFVTCNVNIRDLITTRWIQVFFQRYNIVMRAQCGKLQVSDEAQQRIERRVSFFLGTVARQLMSGELKEENVENSDETHFLINCDDGKTFGFRGEEEVRYMDVTSGGEGMTMMVRLTGGRDGRVANPFMIFKNQDRSYPIRGVADDVPGVSYRTGPKGWIDKQVMVQWLREKRHISALPNDSNRVIFMDNCPGHAITDELRQALLEIRTELRFFPANATHLLQPADSFVIQKIKAAWCKRWDDYKMKKLSEDSASGSAFSKSGKLVNPGKRFFLQLAANAVRDVNKQVDSEGMNFARKAMVRCGLAKQANGLWEVRQLFPHLQNIVQKHRENFDGVDPDSVKGIAEHDN